jgi:hypothetical protein
LARIKSVDNFSGYKTFDVTSLSENPSLNLAVTCYVAQDDTPSCSLFNFSTNTVKNTDDISDSGIGVFGSNSSEVVVTAWMLSKFYMTVFKHRHVYVFDSSVQGTGYVESFELAPSGEVFSLKSSIFYSDMLSVTALAINRV